MSSIKIGFFDSGIGGISVMAYAGKIIPGADYIYYADTDHVPYGEKTREEIISYSETAVRFLIEKGADIIVIACNTATSMAAAYLREKYDIPIIGMEPAVKPAAREHEGSRILVCATPVTLAGEKLNDLIDNSFDRDEEKPVLVPLPGLVNFAENKIFDTDTVCTYLEKCIDHKERFTAVVLGCTHFPYFKDSFRKFFGGGIHLIDGTEGTVNRLKSIASELGFDLTALTESGSVRYYRSGREVKDKESIDYFNLLSERSIG